MLLQMQFQLNCFLHRHRIFVRFLALVALIGVAACGDARFPTAADLATNAATSAWACDFVRGLAPLAVIWAMLFSLVAVFIYGASKAGSGIPWIGQMLSSMNQQTMQGVITGAIIIGFAPTFVLAIFAAIGRGYGLTIECVLGGG